MYIFFGLIKSLNFPFPFPPSSSVSSSPPSISFSSIYGQQTMHCIDRSLPFINPFKRFLSLTFLFFLLNTSSSFTFLFFPDTFKSYLLLFPLPQVYTSLLPSFFIPTHHNLFFCLLPAVSLPSSMTVLLKPKLRLSSLSFPPLFFLFFHIIGTLKNKSLPLL